METLNLGEALKKLVEAAKRAKSFSISVRGGESHRDKYGRFGRGHRQSWEEAVDEVEEELNK